jgi:hypothetical protein
VERGEDDREFRMGDAGVDPLSLSSIIVNGSEGGCYRESVQCDYEDA